MKFAVQLILGSTPPLEVKAPPPTIVMAHILAKLSHGPIRFSGCVGGEASHQGWDQHEAFGGSGQNIWWIFQSWLPQYLMPHTRNPPRKKPGYPRLQTHPHLLDVTSKVQSLPKHYNPYLSPFLHVGFIMLRPAEYFISHVWQPGDQVRVVKVRGLRLVNWWFELVVWDSGDSPK